MYDFVGTRAKKILFVLTCVRWCFKVLGIWNPTRSIEEHKYVVSLLFGGKFSFFKLKFDKNAPKLEKIPKFQMRKLKLKTLTRDEEVELYWTLHQCLLFLNTTLHARSFWESLIHNVLTFLFPRFPKVFFSLWHVGTKTNTLRLQDLWNWWNLIEPFNEVSKISFATMNMLGISK